MKFDKSRIDALINLPDDMLWAEVVRIAGGFGYNLPKETPPHKDIEKMRDAVRGEKINIAEALKMVNQYKKG